MRLVNKLYRIMCCLCKSAQDYLLNYRNKYYYIRLSASIGLSLAAFFAG